MALAGETTCRAVAPCGAGTWGDIPVETNTEHVDPSYAGGGSDGSASTPWTTISAAIAAADSGAIVALAAGSYGAVSLQGKALRLWGRCPEMVEIVGGANDTAAVFIREGADGSELRDLAITGSSIGLLLSGSLAVLADRVWIHDLGSRAVNVEITLGPTALTVARSLVEEAVEFGIQFSGVEGAVVDTVVRDVSRLGNSMFGRGINIQPSQADDIRAAVMVEGALIERTHEAGMFIASSDASVENTVIRDIQAGTQGDARGINIQDKNLTGDPASVTVSGVFIDRTRVVGLYVAGSEADIEHVFVRDTQPNDAGIGGIGISFELNQITDHLASGVIRASVIENSVASGANLSASQVAITGLLVRGVEPNSQGLLGDGISVFIVAEHPTGAVVRGSVFADTLRAGLSNFGATVSIEDSRFDCNAFALNGQDVGLSPFTINDLGGNGCGCNGDHEECKVLSANLEPPMPLGTQQ